MFSIYEVLPEILSLWGMNLITDIDSKKLKRSRILISSESLQIFYPTFIPNVI